MSVARRGQVAACRRVAERLSVSQIAREMEAISINKSLVVLNKVISKLSKGEKHVPYRYERINCAL